MAFRGLTKKGADYLATRLANELAVEFLKVEIGDGAIISGQNPKNQTSLISYKKDVRILKKEQENNAINLTIQITNDDITQGFYLKEIGIYVNDSTSNGCLYWYCNEDNAQYIPAKTDSVIAFEIDIRMEVTNSDATIINWSGKNTWINKDYLEENYTQNGGYKGTTQEVDDRVVSALGKEDGKFPLNEAIQGNVYYFPANKKFYICKETQNRRISVPDVKFEELSIWENRKRLENLDRNFLYKIDRWSPKDEDELIKTGIFQIKGTTSKLKRGFCGSQCFVLVFNTSTEIDDWITQVAFSYYNTFSIAIRTREGITKQWTPWRYLSAN